MEPPSESFRRGLFSDEINIMLAVLLEKILNTHVFSIYEAASAIFRRENRSRETFQAIYERGLQSITTWSSGVKERFKNQVVAQYPLINRMYAHAYLRLVNEYFSDATQTMEVRVMRPALSDMLHTFLVLACTDRRTLSGEIIVGQNACSAAIFVESLVRLTLYQLLFQSNNIRGIVTRGGTGAENVTASPSASVRSFELEPDTGHRSIATIQPVASRPAEPSGGRDPFQPYQPDQPDRLIQPTEPNPTNHPDHPDRPAPPVPAPHVPPAVQSPTIQSPAVQSSATLEPAPEPTPEPAAAQPAFVLAPLPAAHTDLPSLSAQPQTSSIPSSMAASLLGTPGVSNATSNATSGAASGAASNATSGAMSGASVATSAASRSNVSNVSNASNASNASNVSTASNAPPSDAATPPSLASGLTVRAATVRPPPPPPPPRVPMAVPPQAGSLQGSLDLPPSEQDFSIEVKRILDAQSAGTVTADDSVTQIARDAARVLTMRKSAFLPGPRSIGGSVAPGSLI